MDFTQPDSGEIEVDGQGRYPLLTTIALVWEVHQHSCWWKHDGGREHRAGRRARFRCQADLGAAAQITKLSEEFKLAVNPNVEIEHLSVGQQQRVEMLKALFRHARLLILDEPTAVLTPQEVEEFFAILRRMREQGKTVIIITHKLSEVLAISDDVTVMRDGKVVGRVKTRDTNAAELARLMVVKPC
jgi:simple sugar transport system ATP-binding protein